MAVFSGAAVPDLPAGASGGKRLSVSLSVCLIVAVFSGAALPDLPAGASGGKRLSVSLSVCLIVTVFSGAAVPDLPTGASGGKRLHDRLLPHTDRVGQSPGHAVDQTGVRRARVQVSLRLRLRLRLWPSSLVSHRLLIA